MGFLKQMKDLKDTVNAAPGMVDQAMQMKAQAEQMQAAQMAAVQQQAAQAAAAPVAPAAGGDLEPIAGVSIELYAEISRELGGDASQAPLVAAGKGVSAESWQQAMDGWNARMTNPAVAQRFNALYTGRAS
jgi:hypothetical protein